MIAAKANMLLLILYTNPQNRKSAFRTSFFDPIGRVLPRLCKAYCPSGNRSRFAANSLANWPDPIQSREFSSIATTFLRPTLATVSGWRQLLRRGLGPGEVSRQPVVQRPILFDRRQPVSGEFMSSTWQVSLRRLQSFCIDKLTNHHRPGCREATVRDLLNPRWLPEVPDSAFGSPGMPMVFWLEGTPYPNSLSRNALVRSCASAAQDWL